jgi:hypothetical protein
MIHQLKTDEIFLLMKHLILERGKKKRRFPKKTLQGFDKNYFFVLLRLKTLKNKTLELTVIA